MRSLESAKLLLVTLGVGGGSPSCSSLFGPVVFVPFAHGQDRLPTRGALLSVSHSSGAELCALIRTAAHGMQIATHLGERGLHFGLIACGVASAVWLPPPPSPSNTY